MSIKKIFFLVMFVLLVAGCRVNGNADLTCTKIDGDYEYIIAYSFRDGKAYLFDWTLTTPYSADSDLELVENFAMQLNDIVGCSGSFTRNTNGTYTTNQICDLSKMTSEDVVAVYSQNKTELQTTRTEIIDGFKHDSAIICE
jgi:hypothetical protein